MEVASLVIAVLTLLVQIAAIWQGREKRGSGRHRKR